jgi:hypothetical protein
MSFARYYMDYALLYIHKERITRYYTGIREKSMIRGEK